MKKIESIRQLQLVCITVYKDLVDFCESNGLKVYLLGGSLIGAVRHNGFIPWDDDIDVCMSRTDYNRLLALSNGRISSKCSIIDPETSERFKGYISLAVYNNSKLVSEQYRITENSKIGVSIFVYDGVPENQIIRKLYFLHMYILRTQHALCRANFQYVNSKTAKIVGPILSKLYSTDNVYKYKKKILELQKKYPYSDSKYISTNTDTNAWLEVFEKDSFEKAVELEFEGIKSKTFCYYNEHLTRYYGDYMTPPEKEKQEPKHGLNAWIEDSIEFGKEKNEA